MTWRGWSCAVSAGLMSASTAGCSALNEGLCKLMTCSDDLIIIEPPNRKSPSDEAVIEGLRKAREAEKREANGS